MRAPERTAGDRSRARLPLRASAPSFRSCCTCTLRHDGVDVCIWCAAAPLGDGSRGTHTTGRVSPCVGAPPSDRLSGPTRPFLRRALGSLARGAPQAAWSDAPARAGGFSARRALQGASTRPRHAYSPRSGLPRVIPLQSRVSCARLPSDSTAERLSERCPPLRVGALGGAAPRVASPAALLRLCCVCWLFFRGFRRSREHFLGLGVPARSRASPLFPPTFFQRSSSATLTFSGAQVLTRSWSTLLPELPPVTRRVATL